MDTIQSDQFKKALILLLEESFEKVEGVYLDQNTSMLETLAGITAEQASIPVGGKCATLAAQVKHVAFYLDNLSLYLQKKDAPRPDWGEIWRTVSSVTPAEWQSIQDDLRVSYQSTRKVIESMPEWPDEDALAIGMGLVVHSAYHLGEIRQAMCILGQ